MLQHKCKFTIQNDRPKEKPRKYNNSHLDVRFTFILQKGEEKPQCVVCGKVLASESMLLRKI